MNFQWIQKVLPGDDGTPVDTVKEFCHKWAPPSENDTDSYIHSVRQRAKFQPGEHIDTHNFDHMYRLMDAFIVHENGRNPYTVEQMTEALRRAGVMSDKPTPRAKKESNANKVIAAAAGVPVAAKGVEEAVLETGFLVETAWPIANSVVGYVQQNWWLFLLVVVGALGYIGWQRYKDHKELSL